MNKEDTARVVSKYDGSSYKYRCRIEQRKRRTWLGFGKEVTEHRWVLEEYFTSWDDFRYGPWTTLSQAHSDAVDMLDWISNGPARNKNTFYVSR